MNLDSVGLIVTTSGDGGDTAELEGFYNTTRYKRVNNYNDIIKLLEPNQDGIWIRHPTQYPNPKDFSRDQTVTNIIAMGLLNYRQSLYRMFKKQLKRFGLYQNGDIPTPEDVGYYIRAFQFWPLYAFLWFSDLFMVINTLLICLIRAKAASKLQQWLGRHVSWIFIQGQADNAQGVPQDSYGPENVGTDKNHIAALYQAQQVMPTFISYLARKLYKKYRPNGIMYALEVEFKIDNPDFVEIWKPLVDKF